MAWYKKLTSIAVAIAILILFPLSAAAFPWSSKAVNIRGDRGGKIIKYAIRVKKVEDSGRQVRFRGSCDSACTLFLALPKSQTCIAPGAKFRFHLPYGSTPKADRVAAKYKMRKYPSWVRSWIRKNGGLTHKLKTMDYQYASNYLPSCSERGAVRKSFAFKSQLKGFRTAKRVTFQLGGR